MIPDDFAQVLSEMQERSVLLEKELSDPKVYADRLRCRTLNMERKCLSQFFSAFENWKNALREREENRLLRAGEQDEELRELLE